MNLDGGNERSDKSLRLEAADTTTLLVWHSEAPLGLSLNTHWELAWSLLWPAYVHQIKPPVKEFAAHFDCIQLLVLLSVLAGLFRVLEDGNIIRNELKQTTTCASICAHVNRSNLQTMDCHCSSPARPLVGGVS